MGLKGMDTWTRCQASIVYSVGMVSANDGSGLRRRTITSQLPRCRYSLTSRLIALLNSAAVGAETILIRRLSGLITLPSNAPVALSTPTLAWNRLYPIVPCPLLLTFCSHRCSFRSRVSCAPRSADRSSSGERFLVVVPRLKRSGASPFLQSHRRQEHHHAEGHH